MGIASAIYLDNLADLNAENALDFGVGSGGSTRELLAALKSVGKVYGVDCTKPVQAISDDLLCSQHFEYLQTDEIGLPYRDNYFDVVQISKVLHHLRPIEVARRIAEMVRVLKPGGYFLAVEGVRDKMVAASRTQNYLHIIRAFMDREEGIPHFPIFYRGQVVELLQDKLLAVQTEYTTFPQRSDYNDSDNLDGIASFIDSLVEKHRGTKHYGRFMAACQNIKRRMRRTGYSSTPVFVSIRRKLRVADGLPKLVDR